MRNFLRKLFYGRYGIDTLATWILMSSAVLSLLYSLSRWTIFYLLSCGLFIYGLFRMFSKNFVKRQQENYRWCNFQNKYLSRNSKLIRRIKDFPKYKYFKCMNCKQTIRIPRGKGKVEIRCPKCGYSFRSKT